MQSQYEVVEGVFYHVGPDKSLGVVLAKIDQK